MNMLFANNRKERRKSEIAYIKYFLNNYLYKWVKLEKKILI